MFQLVFDVIAVAVVVLFTIVETLRLCRYVYRHHKDCCRRCLSKLVNNLQVYTYKWKLIELLITGKRKLHKGTMHVVSAMFACWLIYASQFCH